jgi:hypothetical protein
MLWARAVGQRAILLLVVLLMGGGAEAAPERRVALVIGNSHYETVARLPNPKPDAETFAESLRNAGFASVTLATDLTRERLVDVLHRFSGEAARADWAVIYYAGHGIEMNGMNYIIPIDARLKADRDLQFEAVPMSQALGAVEGARKLRLLVLDACRDNPFAASMTRSAGVNRSIGRGLAQIEPEAGTLVAYAAKHGQVAEDGNAHSPFVASLSRHILTPGLEINRLFRKVTSDVLTATNRRQEPFTYGSLPDEDFYFRPPATETVRTDPSPVADAARRPGAEPWREASVQRAPALESAAKPAVAERPKAPATQAPTIGRREPQAHPRGKLVFVDPDAPGPARAQPPASPKVDVRPIVRSRPVEKPAPEANRPRRVAQPVQPSMGGYRPSARRDCSTFNGVPVC